MSPRVTWIFILITLTYVVGCGPPKTGTASTPSEPERVPSIYRVQFDTSKGNFVIEVYSDWARLGAERFYQLVKNRFYDGARFFRVVPGFVVQFGINGAPSVSQLWRQLRIVDDPVKQSNLRGTISFATSGPNSRTTQVFINLADNARLDAMGFAPFGKVIKGLEVVDQFYPGYGDGPPNGPNQSSIESQGNAYLQSQFPRLDYIRQAQIADGK